ncbi:hypothetical protein BD769DRAFT_1668790 [Suillus cothurnatus]|nr:hypothetical protein BD769DRAFT_1668790 [Suillus cothurnatus]
MPGATDFFLTQCCANNDTIIAHMKAQVYNMISLSTMEDAFMGLEDDDMASSKNIRLLTKWRDEKKGDERTASNGSRRRSQSKLFRGKFGTDKIFPWKLMPSALADDNVCIKGYPAHKCLLLGEACDATSNSKSKGVAGLTQKEVTILRDSLKVKTMYVEKVDIAEQMSVLASEQPIIIGKTPPSDCSHPDYKGPSCLKASTTTTKVKKSTTSAGKPVPPLSWPSKIVAKPPACKVIEFSPLPISQDENGQQEPASESKYEDASQGKRKKQKSSGELYALKKCTSPVDILPKAARADGPLLKHPSTSPMKGGPLSPLMVDSSTEEQDTPAPANIIGAQRFCDSASDKPEETKGRTRA